MEEGGGEGGRERGRDATVWGVSFKSDRLFEDFPGQAFGPGFSLSMPSLGNIVICQATVIEMIYTFTVYLLWFYVVF